MSLEQAEIIGMFVFQGIPFGMRMAGETFLRMKMSNMFIYFDDLVMASDSAAEYEKGTKAVSQEKGELSLAELELVEAHVLGE